MKERGMFYEQKEVLGGWKHKEQRRDFQKIVFAQ